MFGDIQVDKWGVERTLEVRGQKTVGELRGVTGAASEQSRVGSPENQLLRLLLQLVYATVTVSVQALWPTI